MACSKVLDSTTVAIVTPDAGQTVAGFLWHEIDTLELPGENRGPDLARYPVGRAAGNTINKEQEPISPEQADRLIRQWMPNAF